MPRNYDPVNFRHQLLVVSLILFTSSLASQKIDSSLIIQAKENYSKIRSWYHQDLDSSRYYALIALEQFEVLRDTSKISTCLNALSSINYNKGDLLSAISSARKSYRTIQAYSKASPRKILTCANNLAVMLQESGNSIEAINMLKEILYVNQSKDIPAHSLGAIHQNLGNNFSIIGDYNNAQNHLLTATKLVDSSSTPIIKLSLASNAYRNQSFDLSQNYLNSISLASLPDFSKILHQRLQAKLFTQFGNTNESEKLLTSIIQQVPKDNIVDRILAHINLGDNHLSKQSYELALGQYQIANGLLKEEMSSEQVIYRIEILQNMAICLNKMDQHIKADSLWIEAFSENRIHLKGSKEVLRHDLEWQLIYRQIQNNSSKISFQEKLKSFEDAIVHLKRSRTHLISYASRLNNSSKASDLYDAYIDFLYLNYLDGKKISIQAISTAILDARQLTLKENRSYNRIINNSENQSLKNQYITLTSEIKQLQRLHPELSDISSSNLVSSPVRDSLMTLLDKRKKIQDEYIQMAIKSEKSKPTGGNHLIIHQGKEYYYVIHDYGKKHITKIPLERIDNVLSNLNQDWVNAHSNDLILETLFKLSEILFPEKEIYNLKRISVVVSSGLIQWPLEILPKNKPKTGSLRSLEFLGEKVIIEYVNNLSDDDTYNTERKMLSIAPEFDKGDPIYCGNHLQSPLICNSKEAEYANQYLNSQVLSGNHIELKELIDKIKSHDIIHFATHICIDTTQLYNHTIQLNPLPIHSSDLFNLNWEGKSVILSACASGQGAVRQNEGIMSFSRWLMELGAREVLITYWPIDDCQTAHFMKDLFKHWSNDIDLPEALFLARRDFLSNAEDFELSPKNWGAFTVLRNSKTRDTRGRSSSYLLYALLFCALIPILIWLNKLRLTQAGS